MNRIQLQESPAKPLYAYVGTSTIGGTFAGKGEGIYCYRVVSRDGALSHVATVPVADPTHITVAGSRPMMYAASHSNQFEGEPGAAVVGFRIDSATGLLMRVNYCRIPNPHATHICLDNSERFALIASSMGGAISVLAISADGRLDAISDIVRLNEGEVMISPGETPESKPLPWEPRMSAPRIPILGRTTMPHSVAACQGTRFVLASDLSKNTLHVFELDAELGKLLPIFVHELRTPKAGPRTVAMHPAGHIAYTLNERNSTVSVLRFDRRTGGLQEIQSISTRIGGSELRNTAGGIAIHPSGELLFASNREDLTVVTFSIDRQGTLELIDSVPAMGEFPRHLAITPDGQLLYVSNTLSDCVVVFNISVGSRSKPLIPTGVVTSVPDPTCTVFFEPSAASLG